MSKFVRFRQLPKNVRKLFSLLAESLIRDFASAFLSEFALVELASLITSSMLSRASIYIELFNFTCLSLLSTSSVHLQS